MRSGQLRHSVLIQSPIGDEADFGHGTGSWSIGFAAWAAIEPLTAEERASPQQVEAGVTHRIRLRFRGDEPVKPEQRIVYGERVFHIRGVINVGERDRECEILAAEMLNSASGN